jgi:hypothetical protein
VVKDVPQRIEIVFYRSLSGNEPVRKRQKQVENG